MTDTQKPPHKPVPAWANLLIDYGPVLVFFLSYRLWRPANAGHNPVAEVLAVTKGTMAFIIATIAALPASKWLRGRVAPMLWITTVLVCGFGGLTIWTQNPVFIRHKPTAVYLLFAAVLGWGWWRGRPMLKYLLEAAFEGLSDAGWAKLSRNWAVFFMFLAGLNEVFANPAWFSFDQWLRYKLLVFLPLSFLFTFANLPMLMRHGLGKAAEGEAMGEAPHE